MSSDRDALTCIRCSDVSTHISCGQEPDGQTAATYPVLQVGSSSLKSLVRGRKFPGDVWSPIVPTSGVEGGVLLGLF